VTYFIAVVLGVVQGLTEFLPVSSSAHLILAHAVFGWGEGALGLAFDVACHLGTLAAVLWYFRADLWPMIGAGPAALTGGGGTHGHTVRLVVIGTVPIVILGLLASDWLETLRVPTVVVGTLIIGAVGMVVAERARTTSRGAADIRATDAWAIGCGQALALFPGMSRSGTTITIAMLLGIRREVAARFTFLMSVPAVLAAAGHEALEVGQVGISRGEIGVFVVGVLVSGVVGYLTVRYLIRYLASHSLDVFAYYRVVVAGLVAGWLFL